MARALCLAAAIPAALALVVAAGSGDAAAQGFSWPWEDPKPRPQREPPRPPVPLQQTAPQPNNLGPQPGGPQWMARSPVCAQLEQRLAAENQRTAQTKDALPRIEAEMRQLEQTVQQASRQLDRLDCYEFFLFSKTLKGTKQCRDLAAQADNAKRRQGDLEVQRQQIAGSIGRSYSDDIVRELARNSCGANYQQEASRGTQGNSGSIWQDEGAGSAGAGGFGSSPYATFRTVCVRLCDGYYFPVSFATLPNHFQQDADVCQSKCAAPVELYYHPNPGGAMEQAMSLKSQEPYTRLKTAFRYRKEYVQGCSCKEAEYQAPNSAAPFPVQQQGGDAGDKRAEVLPWEKATTTTTTQQR